MIGYYARRASEYEAIYHRDDPVRQEEQRRLASSMRRHLADRRVIELACGTGYWTERLAADAARIHATDAVPEVLDIARRKPYPPGRVTFAAADVWRPHHREGAFDGGLANFWFSHVERSRIGPFLEAFHSRLSPGAAVFMADNTLVDGVGGELVRRPGLEDTFKLRTLSDGSVHEVLKNYYTERELRGIFSACSSELSVTVGSCFWWVEYATLS